MGMLLKRELPVMTASKCTIISGSLGMQSRTVRQQCQTWGSLEYVRQAIYLNDKLTHVLGKLAPGKKEPPELAAP
jgi:hypothetical protein